MRVMKGSQVNQFIDANYTAPCYGNKDTKKEFIFDERDKDYFVIRTAMLIELPSRAVTEDLIKYQIMHPDEFNDAMYEHEKGDYYAWVGRDVKVLHDPTKKEEVQKIDKRSKEWRDSLLRQHKIATYV